MLSGKNTFLIVILGIIAAGAVATIIYDMRRNRLRRIGQPATAQIIDIKIERVLRSEATDLTAGDSVDRFMNERRYTYTFYYMVDGNRYSHEKKTESREQKYQQGEYVEIIYNPENPKDMMSAEEVNASSSQFKHLAPVFAIVIAVILLFLFLG